ncbi:MULTISPECIES: class I SAM-dependent methyltransferase [Myxococcus]|uniref:SAM-dependent methyltransferase n=1 Tax=Myxococcus xanthus TaxID=34 RepID=A0AAE6KVS1_MYXXA|nr:MULTISPECIES: class I SAM-dependent methyltransferase [Myxococcus]QDE71784.1 SAM-dependent methyltransferase [Myxococcus xanthus]QDE79065.1 SAM-dependent methyltransferase [Myxococcus xanthus]QDE86443.1 SAM-dependent methyltransferase [Myxococcus xanthus]QDF00603.1 SAM-dependent methyltransferase [Myxococcus xanthus]WAM26034.1 class I SAM-dependent methyltransferase [Myxococcus sp. NMCA1]
MASGHQPPEGQAALWNGPAGQAWVDSRDLLEGMFKPFEDLLVEAVQARGARQVLDVGCGTGSTTLAVARRLGAQGHCVGIDISAPMLAAARARAEAEHVAASFIEANAEHHAFERGRFDMVISRFGVMFFDDAVQAFVNLRRSARENARLTFIAWRSPSENPFMTTAERAAAPLLPNMPARQPNAPGQFAFADGDRVHRILEQSGWRDIDIHPIDATCTLPERGLVQYVTRLGPLGRVLHEADERTRTHVIETVRAAFNPYVHGDEVRFTAACWRVEARAPAEALSA